MTVHPGNYRDGDSFKELLDLTIKSGIDPDAAYGDKAYCRPDVLEEIKKLNINAYIPISYSAYWIREGLFSYNTFPQNNGKTGHSEGKHHYF